ncbi:MAG: tRNA (adenosine(37)-N6)-threonylcarbamoyltransferase complex ATPase subunit type 1 TsaE [Acidimicrobiales bacterium]|nr:tRNA (adenosine(37)-N6)-threonylcarbamoyltransferase complex ATPase subunit type 1 TsaE [Acidimicrobiales bacterium]
MILVATSTVEQTQAVAATVAEHVAAGDLLLLVGDLGAGKTAFAQGFGAALGVTEPITSPTFTLARQYQGRLLLHHLDVYRLENLNEVMDLDIPELLEGDSVTLIEWGDAIAPALPANYLELRISFGEGDDDRLVQITAVGPRWSARERVLATALGVAPC